MHAGTHGYETSGVHWSTNGIEHAGDYIYHPL